MPGNVTGTCRMLDFRWLIAPPCHMAIMNLIAWCRLRRWSILLSKIELLAEFRRVLKPDGCLILSSPDKAIYSDGQNTVNEYHVKELYREELEALIGRHFPVHRLLGQKLMFHSAIWSMDGFDRVALDQLAGGTKRIHPPVLHSPPCTLLHCVQPTQPVCRTWMDVCGCLMTTRNLFINTITAEIKRHIAAGGIIAGLEKEIAELNSRSDLSKPPRRSWWRRFLGKA